MVFFFLFLNLVCDLVIKWLLFLLIFIFNEFSLFFIFGYVLLEDLELLFMGVLEVMFFVGVVSFILLYFRFSLFRDFCVDFIIIL